MNGFWDHKTKPSTFVVKDGDEELFRGPFKQAQEVLNKQTKFSMTTLDQQVIKQFGGFIQKFKILHHGWDMDSYGYVVYPPDQQRKLVLTNHSKPYEADVSELRQKVIEYQQAIGETNSVIELFEKHNS